MNIKKSLLAGNFVKHICKHSDPKICFTKTLAPPKLSGGCFGASLSVSPQTNSTYCPPQAEQFPYPLAVLKQIKSSFSKYLFLDSAESKLG